MCHYQWDISDRPLHCNIYSGAATLETTQQRGKGFRHVSCPNKSEGAQTTQALFPSNSLWMIGADSRNNYRANGPCFLNVLWCSKSSNNKATEPHCRQSVQMEKWKKQNTTLNEHDGTGEWSGHRSESFAVMEGRGGKKKKKTLFLLCLKAKKREQIVWIEDINIIKD